MPRKFEAYDPDWIDVNAQLTAIGGDFGLVCEFTTRVERDRVVVYARCRKPGVFDIDSVVVQAMASRPIKSKPDLAVMCFALAQDCWRQLDRGTFATASQPVNHEWNGRPQIARRSERS